MTSNVYQNYFTATVLLNKIYSVIKKKMPSLINPNVNIHYKNDYIKQQYLPDKIKNIKFYTPKDNKNEKALKDILDKLEK